MKRLRALAAALAGMVLAAMLPAPALASPVLLISIDGLRADDAADARAMPALAALRREGSWADGVTGVWPSLTYPSHTTLVTGVAPAGHGIGGNQAFDPMGRNQEGWMWFAEDIRADTLWAAARRAGLTTAAVNWPVTVGAPIDFNLPQIWHTRGAEDAKLTRALSTPGLVASLEAETGTPYPLGSDGTCGADAVRARFAGALILTRHPALTALHLECLDHLQHDFGPGSPESKAARVSLDRLVGDLVRLARQDRPDIAIAIVSDHGFAPVHTAVNLDAAFREAGLLQTGPEGEITGWTAAPWAMSGTAGVVLKDPADAAARQRVEALLDRLKADPRLGIGRILCGDGAKATGGDGAIVCWIVFRPGYSAGGYASGPLIQPSMLKGTHGYPPDEPAMAATYILAAPGHSEKGPRGPLRMTAIAPELAAILGIALANPKPGLP